MREMTTWRAVDINDKTLKIRASFLRYLILDATLEMDLPPKGVSVGGAYIDGNLDLNNNILSIPVVIVDSVINGVISMYDCSSKLLNWLCLALK